MMSSNALDGLVSKERQNERATYELKSDNSKAVSKERQEYYRFELKFMFLMTKLTLILTLNAHTTLNLTIKTTITTLNQILTDPHDSVDLLIQYLFHYFVMSLFQSVALSICRSFERLPLVPRVNTVTIYPQDN